MKMKKIQILAFTGILILAMGLSGCGGSDGSNGTDGSNGANGSNGVNGTDGPTGADGIPSLITLTNSTDEPVGNNCPGGGVKIDSGLDNNSNGILDDIEIAATEYTCDGVDGITAVIHVTEIKDPSYYDLRTGIVSVKPELDIITGSGNIVIKFSVIDNEGLNTFTVLEYVDGQEMDQKFPRGIRYSGSARVMFESEFIIEPNHTELNIEYDFEVIYDGYTQDGDFKREVFVAGKLVQKPYKAGLTEEEIVELIEITITETIEDVEITVEAPECVTCPPVATP